MKAFAKPQTVLDEQRAGRPRPRPFVAHNNPTVDRLLSLQRLAGNRAVTTLLFDHSLPVQRSGDSESREDQQREFAAVIDRFNREGLPTKFLAITFPQIRLEKLSADEAHYVFDTQTLEVPEGEVVNSSAPDSIYHESVHAFFDIHKDDPDVKKLIDAERGYYQLSYGEPKGHPERGRLLFDADRVFQEAAAEYTATRISAFWRARSLLMKAINQIGKSEKNVRLYVDMAKDQYDRDAATTVFGYSEESGDQITTTRPMNPEFKEYLDNVLLEGKFPDHFVDVEVFKPLLEKINSAASAPIPGRSP